MCLYHIKGQTLISNSIVKIYLTLQNKIKYTSIIFNVIGIRAEPGRHLWNEVEIRDRPVIVVAVRVKRVTKDVSYH